MLRPAEDDLITRAIPYFADKYIHTHPSGSSGSSGSSGDSGSSARSGANVDTVPVCGPVEVFVPTGALQLLEMLHRYLPKHKLLLADFDMLPPPDLGVWHDLRTLANRALGRAPPPPHNAPLVASRDAGQGVTVDRPSYLDAAASPADIFFPTDFPALADAPHRPPRRKHTFSPEAHLRRGVLNIVVVKDPYFWAASMRRNPYQARIDTSDLSAPFEYQGRLLHGVADYWYE